MNTPSSLHGLLAGFPDPERLLAAAKRARADGYRKMDAYTPFPVEGLTDALGGGGTAIPLIMLIAGIAGAAGGYFMQWYALAIDYSLNVGGRPLHSWPMFIPVTFELTILCSALAGFFAALLLNGLPRPHHPVFNAPEFARASRDRFFLCIEAADARFDRDRTRRFLESCEPESMSEVED